MPTLENKKCPHVRVTYTKHAESSRKPCKEGNESQKFDFFFEKQNIFRSPLGTKHFNASYKDDLINRENIIVSKVI